MSLGVLVVGRKGCFKQIWSGRFLSVGTTAVISHQRSGESDSYPDLNSYAVGSRSCTRVGSVRALSLEYRPVFALLAFRELMLKYKKNPGLNVKNAVKRTSKLTADFLFLLSGLMTDRGLMTFSPQFLNFNSFVRISSKWVSFSLEIQNPLPRKCYEVTTAT